jgi:hypothetical protein
LQQLIVPLAFAVFVTAVAKAEPFDYRVLATNKTSTMEKELPSRLVITGINSWIAGDAETMTSVSFGMGLADSTIPPSGRALGAWPEFRINLCFPVSQSLFKEIRR